MIFFSASIEAEVVSDGLKQPIQCTETNEADCDADHNFLRNVPNNADMHFAYATTEGKLLIVLSLRNFPFIWLKWNFIPFIVHTF